MQNIGTHLSSKKRLSWALILGVIYFSILALGSYISGSLSLSANAGHMLMHSSVLLIALIAAHVAEKQANENFNAGYARIDSLGAFINGLILLAVALFIAIESFEQHHDHAHEIDLSVMGMVSVTGLILHSIAATILYKGRKESLNVHTVFLHVFLDVSITLATLTAAVAIHFGAPEELDAWLAFVIAISIGFSALKLLINSTHQLMDRKPKHIDYQKIIRTLKEINHVTDVHNVIIRQQGQTLALSAHIVLKGDCVHSDHWIECRKKADEILKGQFDIGYSVLQMEVSEDHAEHCEHNHA